MLRARGLYAIVDPEFCLGRDPFEVARAIVAGGCAVLQLRAKRMEHGSRRALAQRLAALCATRDIAFVVNDDPALAAEVGAGGVHLGQADMAVQDARAVVPAGLRIGLSTHSRQQALDAVQKGADLIGFGPIFSTQSKDNPDPVVGLECLSDVCKAVPLPVVAIGGITLANVALVARCGPALVAAIGALCGAADPAAAASALHRAMIQPQPSSA